MSDKPAFKPCPFCGNAKSFSFETDTAGKWGFVRCNGCGVAAPDVRTGYQKEGWQEDALAEWNTRAALAEQPPADKVEEALADLRARGWRVAVHNDYRLDDKWCTFWLLTHESGRGVKGEATSDAEALALARAAIDALGDEWQDIKGYSTPLCPAGRNVTATHRRPPPEPPR